jgi:hypothetical protein
LFRDNTVPLWWRVPKLEVHFIDENEVSIDVSNYLVNWPHEQDNRVFTMQMPLIATGSYKVSFEGNFGVSENTLPVRVKPGIVITEPLHDDFNDMALTKQNFLIAHKQWGGTGQVGGDVVLKNGGVVAQNVNMYPDFIDPLNNVNGVMRCSGNGSFYNGPIFGVDRLGNPAPDGRKTEVGACIATRDYTGPGRYRMRVRSPDTSGACLAFWTFHYEEAYPNDERYQEFKDFGDEGLHEQGSAEDGYYIVRNNEIDIEWPTSIKDQPDMEEVSHDTARLNTWQGELRTWELEPSDPDYFSEYTDDFDVWSPGVPLNDGEWHEVGFDWFVNDPNSPGNGKPANRVEFYVDGVHTRTTSTHVPTTPGRFWLGVWYPRAPGNRWAGRSASYITEHLDIDYFHFDPFLDNAADGVGETYPNDVWHKWEYTNFHPRVLGLPPNEYPQADPENKLIFDQHATLLGGNPPTHMYPYRLEWRQDKPQTNPNQNGEVRFDFPEHAGKRVTVTVTTVWLSGESGQTLRFIDFQGPNQTIPNAVGDWEVTFTLNGQGRFVIGQSNGTGGNNGYRYEGLMDIKLILDPI